MKVTIEIDADTLNEVQRATGITKKGPAIQSALGTFVREYHKRATIGRVLNGGIDFQFSNDEIEALGDYDPH